MILTDLRSEEVRRWAEAEVIHLAGLGTLDEASILAAVLRTTPWVGGDPWAQETIAAVARRAAMATLAGLRRSRSLPSGRPVPLGLALLGGVAVLGAVRALVLASQG